MRWQGSRAHYSASMNSLSRAVSAGLSSARARSHMTALTRHIDFFTCTHSRRPVVSYSNTSALSMTRQRPQRACPRHGALSSQPRRTQQTRCWSFARPRRRVIAPYLFQAVCLVPELPLQLLAGATERVAVGHQEVALLQQHVPQLVQVVPGLDAQVAGLPRAACAACAACPAPATGRAPSAARR